MKSFTKKVSNKRSHPLFKPACAAVLSVFCSLSPSIAKASCVGLNTANATCTGTDSTTRSSTTTGSSTIQLTDWTLTNGYFNDFNNGFSATPASLANGTQTLIADNININSGSLMISALYVANAAPQGNIDVQINNSVLTGDQHYALTLSAQGLSGVANSGGTVSAKLADTTLNSAAGAAISMGSAYGDVSLEMTRVNVASVGGVSVSSMDGNVSAVTHDGTITTTGSYSSAHALDLLAFGLNGTVTVDNSSTLNTAKSGIATASKNGLTSVTNSGAINMNRTDSDAAINAGIYSSALNGDIQINNSGLITTTGGRSNGIYANRSGIGNTTIINSGDISTNGINSHGMYVDNSAATVSGNVDVINNGNLNIHVANVGKGIYLRTTDNSITNLTNNGNVKHDSAAAFNMGLETVSRNNSSVTINNNGTVEGAYYGILAWSANTVHTGGQSNINIGHQGIVDAVYGITADLSERNTINIADGGLVNGKVDAIQFRSVGTATPVDTVNNSGAITSDIDSILNTNLLTSGASITFNNQATGQMTGVMTAANADTTINNEGVWNLRKFEDGNADGMRELLSVATTNLGSGGNNHIVNSGTLNLLGDDGSAITLNNTNEYSTGYSANTMALAGATQGQILGVKTFTNSGIIDLSNNHTVGDVLLISGGNTAGTAGGGEYIANGGQLKIDAILNEGGLASSQSDMLIVDGTRLGSGATSILVNNVGGTGASTVDNGIEVVRVLDSANSAAGVFKLGARTTAGLYEYDVYQGGVGTDADDGNWYLRSLRIPDQPDAPVINPESTVYLRNLNAASTMFMHTLHDRLGEPQFTDPYKTDRNNPSSVWVRVVSNHTDSTGGNGQIDLNTDTNLVHLGADIARWSNDGTDRWNVGLMGAYGQSKIDASSNQLGVTPSGFKRNATGKVDGYSVGGYATWYQNKDKPEGLYVDTWAQYGWYDNKVQGNTKAEESYNSSGWTASVEAGYAMIARDEGNNRQWIFEPQVQVAYNNFTSDDYTDAGGTRITDNNANGVITRVGARLYGRSTQNDNGIQPFVEANWWYSDAKNSLAFNGVTMSDGTPNSRYELKAGLQGEVAKNWLMWGHAGVQFGENDFNRYEGMVGIKRMF